MVINKIIHYFIPILLILLKINSKYWDYVPPFRTAFCIPLAVSEYWRLPRILDILTLFLQKLR